MPKLSRVKLLKQIKIAGNWTHAPALYDSKGRVRRDHVRINGADEVHAEGANQDMVKLDAFAKKVASERPAWSYGP